MFPRGVTFLIKHILSIACFCFLGGPHHCSVADARGGRNIPPRYHDNSIGAPWEHSGRSMWYIPQVVTQTWSVKTRHFKRQTTNGTSHEATARYLQTYNITFLEELIVAQTVKEFPAFHGNKVHYHVHRGLPLITAMRKTNPICLLTPISFKHMYPTLSKPTFG